MRKELERDELPSNRCFKAVERHNAVHGSNSSAKYKDFRLVPIQGTIARVEGIKLFHSVSSVASTFPRYSIVCPARAPPSVKQNTGHENRT